MVFRGPQIEEAKRLHRPSFGDTRIWLMALEGVVVDRRVALWSYRKLEPEQWFCFPLRYTLNSSEKKGFGNGIAVCASGQNTQLGLSIRENMDRGSTTKPWGGLVCILHTWD